MEARTPDLTQQLTYAEDWLARARQQVDQGQHARGALTLLLAEAELQRAREQVMASAARTTSTRTRWTGAGMAGLTAAAFIGLALLVWAVAPRGFVAHDTSSVPVVVFEGETGSMLRMVQSPQAPVERTVIKPVIFRVATPQAPPAALVPVVPPAPAPALAPANRPQAPAVVTPTMAPAATTPAPPVSTAAPAPPLLSEADLIELVLAAERSLRRAAGQ